jgi:DNA-binding protein
MEKLLRKAGAQRVADNAKAELADLLEEIANDIGTESITFSQHAGRKTITAADIKLARKRST